MSALEIYEPVRFAVRAVFEMHRQQTNAEHVQTEKEIIREIIEDFENDLQRLELNMDFKE